MPPWSDDYSSLFKLEVESCVVAALHKLSLSSSGFHLWYSAVPPLVCFQRAMFGKKLGSGAILEPVGASSCLQILPSFCLQWTSRSSEARGAGSHFRARYWTWAVCFNESFFGGIGEDPPQPVLGSSSSSPDEAEASSVSSPPLLQGSPGSLKG